MVILLPVGGLIAVCADSEVSDAEIEKFIASLGGSAAQAPSEQSKSGNICTYC